MGAARRLPTVTQKKPMLSTGFSTALTVAAVGFSSAGCAFAAFAWRIAWKSRQDAGALAGWVHQNSKSSVTLKRLTELETELTELTDSYTALLKSHQKLRSRIGMRENRARGASQDDDEPVQSTRDKRKLRLAAKKAGFL